MEIKKMRNLISEKKILLLILILALFLRIYYFVGINLNDDTEYTHSSYRISIGDIKGYPIGSIDSIRGMMVLPLSLLFFLFGVSDYIQAIYPIFCSLGSIFVTYLIGKLIFNKKVGLITAFFLSIIPLDVVYSTQLVPSVQVNFFMLLSVYFFLLGEKKFSDTNLFNLKNQNKYFLLSGIFFGLAYLANIISVLYCLVFLGYVIVNRKIKLNYIYVALGLLIIFSLETLFFYSITHRPLWRLDVIHKEEIRVGTNISLHYYPRILKRLFNPDFMLSEGHFGVFVYLTILSSVYLIFKKDKKSYFFILWIVFVMLYLQFGVMTSTLKPIAKWIRYLIILLPPSALLVANSLTIKGTPKLVSSTVIIIIILTTPYYLVNTVEDHRINTEDFKNIYNFLKDKENKTIYIDYGSFGFVDFYFGYKRDIKALEALQEESSIKDSFVVINGSLGIVGNMEMRSKLPEFAKNPPENWELVKIIEGQERGFYVTYDPKIYYVE